MSADWQIFWFVTIVLTLAAIGTVLSIRVEGWLEARGQAFDDDLAAQRDKGGAVIRPLVLPGPLTAELLVRAQSRHIESEWARLDEEASS